MVGFGVGVGIGGGNEGKDWKSEEKTGRKVEGGGGGEGEEEALFIKGSRASINSPPEVIIGSDDDWRSTDVLFQKSIAAAIPKKYTNSKKNTKEPVSYQIKENRWWVILL